MAALPKIQETPAGKSALTSLASEEARSRLEKFGPNAMPDTALHPLRRALTKFWAPVLWLLEAAIVLEVVLGKNVEAAIIAGLLAVNGGLDSVLDALIVKIRQERCVWKIARYSWHSA